MEQKRFTKNDAAFVCAHCGREVEPLGFTSRNHCPFCLWSVHVDVNPGDRASECRGMLRPVKVITDPRKGYIIVHKCEKCGATRRNRAAVGKCDQPDDLSLLIKLTASEFNGDY